MSFSDAAVRGLVTTIARLQQDVRSQARAAQAAHRSVELGDQPVRYYDSSGNIAGEVTVDASGLVVLPFTGDPPNPPTEPDAFGVESGIRVVWDGTFVDTNWNSQIAWVEVHQSINPEFDPIDLTQISTFQSFYGGEYFYSSLPEEGERHFCLVTVDRAGNRSIASGYASATALAVPVRTDGISPATSPAAVVRGGLGVLFTSWTPIANFDAVTYEVHVSTVDGFAPSPATLAVETPASSATVRAVGGVALAYDTIYYVKVIAKDGDGAANAGTQGSAALMKVTGDDIAVNYVYAGNLLADQIIGGQISADLLVSGAIRTASSGGRVEMGPFGLRVYGTNGVDILVDLNGIQNKFSGSVDAEDILVRDGLELFGQNNAFASNAKVTLRTGQSGSATPPVGTTFYKTQDINPALRTGFRGLVGYHVDGGNEYGVSEFFGEARLCANSRFYELGNFTVTAADGSLQYRTKPGGYTRISTPQGERAVVLGELRENGYSGYPPIGVRLFNDAPMVANGSVPPVETLSLVFRPFSFWISDVIGRFIDSANQYSRPGFSRATMNRENGGDLLRGTVYDVQPNGAAISQYTTTGDFSFAPYRVHPDEGLQGVEYGRADELGFPGFTYNIWVFHTTHQNLIFNTALTRIPLFEWPVAPNSGGHRVFAAGSIANNTCTEYNVLRYSNNYDMAPNNITRYSNWTHQQAVQMYQWFQYAWRGHSSKSPEWLTKPSPIVGVPIVKRAWMSVTVPPLPTPEAGQNAARDINKDVYGWVLYAGYDDDQPLNSQMFRQAASPAGDPTTIQTVEYSMLAPAVGANPLLATQNFPNLSPAKIVSSAESGGQPLLVLDGDGNIRGKTLTIDGVSFPSSLPNRILPTNTTVGNSAYNSMINSGWYVMQSTAANRPTDQTCYLEVRAYEATYIEQIARNVVNGNEYRRTMVAGTWGPWWGRGLWVDFTPSALNAAFTNMISKYMRIGNAVSVKQLLSLNGPPTGTVSINAPLPINYTGWSQTATQRHGQGMGWVNGSGAYSQGWVTLGASDRVQIFGGSVGSPNVGVAWHATHPTPWVSSDRWSLDYTYECTP